MIVVGAPVYERGWILQDWFDHFRKQTAVHLDELYFLLNYGPSSDETLAILEQEAASGTWAGVEVLVDYEGDHSTERDWGPERYATLTRLRNALLRRVRQLRPDYYFSVDTDMLLAPDVIRVLRQDIEGYDGIAPLTYMTLRGTGCPNCMERDDYIRPWIRPGTFQVYACFGAVLMRPNLYQLADYAVHIAGEDLGWAENVQRAGLTLALCPLVKAKHVMIPPMRDVIDERVGF